MPTIPSGSPYRAPCGGWPATAIVGLGDCANHFDPTENGFAVKTNVTTLFDGSALLTRPVRSCGDTAAGIIELHACSGGQTAIADNCYSAGAGTVNSAFCRKLGFKNLAAGKYWHGRWGFTGAGADGCSGYTASPGGTKYRTKAMTCTETSGTYSGGVYTTLATQITARTYTIGRYTGLVTETAKSDGGYTGPGYNGAQKAAQFDYACGTWADAGALGGPTVTVLNGGTVSGATVNSSSVSATAIAFDVTILATGAFNRYVVSVTLSDPYTSADVNTDLNGLLAAWDLADDTLYPWRQDGQCYLAPYVTYDEIQDLDVNQFSLPADTFADTSGGRYVVPATGAIVGLPVPAGYGRYWDKTHITWINRDCGSGPFWDIHYIGAFAPDWCPNATQWFDEIQGGQGSAGAWAGYPAGNAFSNKVIKVVWAETLNGFKPSHNYARPCGAVDAAYLDQTTATCSGGHLVGTPRFSSVPGSCPVPPASGYQWNDTSPKGDFIFKEWAYDYRDIAITPGLRATTGGFKTFTATQSCVTFIPCYPAVATITPAGTGYTFPNAVNYTLPDLGIDEPLGCYWQARVEQWMIDPLWQVPSSACSAQTEDDGTGTVGTYLPPFEEARLAPPAGAPAYPSGCGVNYTGYVSARNSGGGTIPECEPPDKGQCQYPRWITQLNQEQYCTWDIPPDECAYVDA